MYDRPMTTRTNYHTDTAAEFLIKGRAHLAEGDLLQASEKGWGAAAQMVKAVAETRGWRHSTHRDLYSTHEPAQTSSATTHQNFEGDMRDLVGARRLLAAVLD